MTAGGISVSQSPSFCLLVNRAFGRPELGLAARSA